MKILVVLARESSNILVQISRKDKPLFRVSPSLRPTGEAHFCTCFLLRFDDQKRPLLCHIDSYCFAPISIALRPSRPASKLASKPARRCFVLISMVSRHWSLRLALEPVSNFVSSCKLFGLLQFSIPLRPRGFP